MAYSDFEKTIKNSEKFLEICEEVEHLTNSVNYYFRKIQKIKDGIALYIECDEGTPDGTIQKIREILKESEV